MRVEYAAALTNFLLILLIVIGAMAFSRADGSVHVYADPIKAAVSAALIAVMIATPLGTFAFWRTWVHAQRFLARETKGWQGVFEAGAVGFALLGFPRIWCWSFTGASPNRAGERFPRSVR